MKTAEVSTLAQLQSQGQSPFRVTGATVVQMMSKDEGIDLCHRKIWQLEYRSNCIPTKVEDRGKSMEIWDL